MKNTNCERCKEMDNIVGFTLDGGGNAILDLRFDPENKELDLRLLNTDYYDIDESIQIVYCPFCGRKL
jgi:HKD family nuclease